MPSSYPIVTAISQEKMLMWNLSAEREKNLVASGSLEARFGCSAKGKPKGNTDVRLSTFCSISCVLLRDKNSFLSISGPYPTAVVRDYLLLSPHILIILESKGCNKQRLPKWPESYKKRGCSQNPVCTVKERWVASCCLWASLTLPVTDHVKKHTSALPQQHSLIKSTWVSSLF